MIKVTQGRKRISLEGSRVRRKRPPICSLRPSGLVSALSESCTCNVVLECALNK